MSARGTAAGDAPAELDVFNSLCGVVGDGSEDAAVVIDVAAAPEAIDLPNKHLKSWDLERREPAGVGELLEEGMHPSVSIGAAAVGGGVPSEVPAGDVDGEVDNLVGKLVPAGP